MRVFITGGAGLIGSAASAHLIERGFEVHLTDLAPQTDVPHTTYSVCDIMDFDALHEQMRGCDAVVHMAALRNPFYGAGQDVYRINTAGTFNVFEAAAKNGIRRIVQASSINALGCAWNIGDFTPQYFPVDEDHPTSTTDPYSFSKQQIEDIGAYYWRRDGISSIAFRLPGIYKPEQRQNLEFLGRRHGMREFLGDFLTLPQAEQARQMAIVRGACLSFRAARSLEYPNGTWDIPLIEGIDKRLLFAYTFDRYNLWASLEVRDAARAIECALTADYTGGHVLFASDTHNSLDYDSETLARLFFPTVAERKRPLTDSRGLINVDRARELIGFEPQYSLRGAYDAEDR